MDRISDSRKCMASLAVFRTLYDENKDLYSVIASFSKQLIVEQNLRSFYLQDFCNRFNDVYGFDLPSAVIKTSLKRLKFLDVSKTEYSVNVPIDKIDSGNVAKLEEENCQRNKHIVEDLFDYVEKQSKTTLDDINKNKLYNSFCSFVIDENSDVEYKTDISSFILNNSKNTNFLNQLNDIRQGLVIFVGLSYNTTYDRIDEIENKLNIYLETEILFHRAGYNGMLYQTLFNDFYQLVNEINKKAQKELISLFYFNETAEEIRKYFSMAENIVRGKKQLDPSKNAMKYIVNQCKTPSDVKALESIFFQDLQNAHIFLDRQENYYDKEHYRLNIEQKDFEVSESYSEDEIYEKLKLLNYINIKRGGKSQSIFSNIGHILLTGSSLTFKIAFDERIRKEGDVPLATGLDFLTNRFWLITNKGLSANMHLTSFNILTKAKIAVSTIVNESIAKKYFHLLQEEEKGTFDLEKQKVALAGLHKHAINPEDLDSQNQKTYLNFAKKDIDAYVAEQELERQRANENEILANKALSVLTERENVKLKEKHKKQIEVYKERRNKWVKKRISIKMYKSIGWTIGYLLVIAIVCVLLLLKSNALISVVVTILTTIIPFIRPICNHEIIKHSIQFLFSKQTRSKFMMSIERKYYAEVGEKVPKLSLVNKEDMIERIK